MPRTNRRSEIEAEAVRDDLNRLDRAITGALRDTIYAHGPITPHHIGSAVKRIRSAIANAGLAPAEMKRGEAKPKDRRT